MFYCLNFIFICLNLLFILPIQYLNFSDQSTCNLEQESSIWTQGGIQRLVDRTNQDQKTGDPSLALEPSKSVLGGRCPDSPRLLLVLTPSLPNSFAGGWYLSPKRRCTAPQTRSTISRLQRGSRRSRGLLPS